MRKYTKYKIDNVTRGCQHAFVERAINALLNFITIKWLNKCIFIFDFERKVHTERRCVGSIPEDPFYLFHKRRIAQICRHCGDSISKSFDYWSIKRLYIVIQSVRFAAQSFQNFSDNVISISLATFLIIIASTFDSVHYLFIIIIWLN